jgi:hypothetical protein
MQTFMPSGIFSRTARILDWRRLGKQRVEGYQILQALHDDENGWNSHPAVNMWRNFEGALAEYTLEIISEWKRRGYNDNMEGRLHQEFGYLLDGPRESASPPWIGDPRLHSSHRAALLHKDPEHYGKFGWSEEPEMDYFWPTHHFEYKMLTEEEGR